jgi:hypothetical protein
VDSLVHERYDTIFKRNLVEPHAADFEERVYYEAKKKAEKHKYKDHNKAGEKEKEIYEKFKKR